MTVLLSVDFRTEALLIKKEQPLILSESVFASHKIHS